MKINKSFFGLVAACMVLLFATSGSAQDLITYYHTDTTGSPIAATDANGNVLWREHFAPYGERLRQDISPRTNRMWFTGHHHNDDTGLTYAGARHYDPMIGRFTGIDPVGTDPEDQFSFNRYAYANNNPYRYVDPNGETAVATGVTIFVGGTIYIAGCQVSGSCKKFGEDVWRGIGYLQRQGLLGGGLLNRVFAEQSGNSSSSAGGADLGGIAAMPPDPDDKERGEQSDKSLRYVPTKKHEAGGWGTRMDLDNQTAQRVLNSSIQGGRARYGVNGGKVYEFKSDNAGGWHGYSIPGNEAPSSALREFLKRGDISRPQYNRLIKGK